MLSEETFPEIEIMDDDEFEIKHQLETAKSLDDFNTFMSSENGFNDTMNFNNSLINSIEIERLINSDLSTLANSQMLNDKGVSFQSVVNTKEISPPQAPIKIKKKKSYSCHDLQVTKKHNYDHVQSKVKKIIENLAEDRRKTLSRHKSMPLCTQTATIDEKPDDGNDINDLKRELRRKSIKIYELEEQCEFKDSQIYELECEKSKMKMTFDSLRNEMQKLKEIEQLYKKMTSSASHRDDSKLRSISAQTQTEDSGFNDSFKMISLQESSYFISKHKFEHLQDPRQTNTTILNGETSISQSYQYVNQSHFSEVNNSSSDNLIPEASELPLTESDNARNNVETTTNSETSTNATEKKKSKKKLRRFFRLVPCIFHHK